MLFLNVEIVVNTHGFQCIGDAWGQGGKCGRRSGVGIIGRDDGAARIARCYSQAGPLDGPGVARLAR